MTGRNSMVLFQPIALNNESIGTIFIEADLKDLSGWLTRFLEIDFLVSLASLAVAFLLSTRLQRVISGPIQELANTTSSVSSRRTARVKREGIVVSIVDVLLCALAAKRKWAIFTRDPDPTNYAKVLPISIHGINRSCFVS